MLLPVDLLLKPMQGELAPFGGKRQDVMYCTAITAGRRSVDEFINC